MSIRWWHPVLGDAERDEVVAALASNFPNDGEVTEEFERGVAKVCGAKYAVGVTSGTAALFSALAACDIGPGDEVIVPDLTFIATANAVSLTGASPVLVDVCADDMGLDPERVERAITTRTRAILPVHVNGRAAKIHAILDIARRRGLRVIEDAAEAFGSSLDGRGLGSFSDAGCFSFAPSKIITTGQGGAVVTNDDRLHARLRELKDQGRRFRGTGGADEHPRLGFNFKLSNILAAIGVAQLRDFDARRRHLKTLYTEYRRQLAEVPGIEVPRFRLERGESPQWIDVLTARRDGLADFLAERAIDTRKFWYPLHTQEPYARDDAAFPQAITLSANGLWLPSALSVTLEDVAKVCGAIHEFAASR